MAFSKFRSCSPYLECTSNITFLKGVIEIINQSYNVIVGAGGNSGSIVDEIWYDGINGSQGGTSSFGSLVQANGGGGGKYANDAYTGGTAGATGCGNGGKGGDARTGTGNNGSSNTTISEFNDNITFYSGGGGSGGANGGSPNGAKGGKPCEVQRQNGKIH